MNPQLSTSHDSKTVSVSKKRHKLPRVAGLRLTKQRQIVYNALMDKRDHPTAAELYERTRLLMPGISLATVYNCLEALVKYKIVRQVNFERSSSRFCPNLVEHGHILDELTGVIHDVVLKEGVDLSDFLHLPQGACVTAAEFTLKGVIPPYRA